MIGEIEPQGQLMVRGAAALAPAHHAARFAVVSALVFVARGQGHHGCSIAGNQAMDARYVA
jgi:hypothetical protein